MTLLERAIAALAPEVGNLAVSLPTGIDAKGVAVPVVYDDSPTFEGPLAGVLAGLEHALTLPRRPTHLLTVPVDLPFLPLGMADRLASAIDDPAAIVFARGPSGRAPLCALWPLSIASSLAAFLSQGSERSVGAFLAGAKTRQVVFEAFAIGGEDVDPFFNINTLADLDEAARLIAPGGPWSSRHAESGSTK